MLKRKLHNAGYAIIAIVMLTFVCISFVACCDEPEPIQCVIVTGKHNNSKDIISKMMESETDKAINAALSSFGSVTLVNSEGEPQIFYQSKYDQSVDLEESKIEHKRGNRNWESEYLFPLVENAKNSIFEYGPSSNEIDLLEALSIAEKEFDAAFKDRQLIICDTGLSTSGDVSFLKKDWYSLLFQFDEEKLERLCEELKNQMAIPDLSGIKIIWYGLGEVDGEQTIEKLQSENLRKIWERILEYAMGTDDVHDSQANCGVEFVKGNYSTGIEYEGAEVTNVLLNFKDDYIPIPVCAIDFEPNSDKFKDEDKAVLDLAQIANYISVHDEKILIVGCTHDDGIDKEGEAERISIKRVMAVQRILTDVYNIELSKLELYWAGNDAYWTIPGCDKNDGDLNRVALITPDSTGYAGEIRNNPDKYRPLSNK